MGWFVANEYSDEELKMNPPTQPQVEKVSGKIFYFSVLRVFEKKRKLSKKDSRKKISRKIFSKSFY